MPVFPLSFSPWRQIARRSPLALLVLLLVHPARARCREVPAWRSPAPVDPAAGRWVTGKGLELSSADHRFSLRLRPRAQFLYALADPHGSGAGREPTQAVMVRRARLVASGHMWGERNGFKMELAFSPRDLGMSDRGSGNPPITDNDNALTRSPLLDFYVTFGRLRDLSLRVGQYKVPYSRQRQISSGDLMFVDRAITNREFSLDRDIGLDLRSQDLFGLGKRLRYRLGVFSGEGHSSFAPSDLGVMVLGRVEVLPLGDFEDMSESDHRRELSPRLGLGLAWAWVDNAKGNRGITGKRPADGGLVDSRNLTADAIFKYAGLSAQVEIYWREVTRVAGDRLDDAGVAVPLEAPRDGWGAMVQAGYMLPGVDVELAGRFALIRGSGEGSSLEDTGEAGGAVSWYIASHSLKLQADALRLWSEAIGRGDNQARLQLQVAF